MEPNEDVPWLRSSAEEIQSQSDLDGPRVHHQSADIAGRDSIGGNNVNASGASVKNGSIVGGNYSPSKKTAVNFGGVLVAVVAVVALVIIGKVVYNHTIGAAPSGPGSNSDTSDFQGSAPNSTSTGPITKDTLCGEYLVQSSSDRDSAIKRVGLQLHVHGTGSPLMMPEVDYECGDEPNTAFGTVVGRQHGY